MLAFLCVDTYAEPMLLPLSPFDAGLIERAVESSAGGEPFAVRVALSSVILNRMKCKEYPDSVLRIIECANFLSLDREVEVSEKTHTALIYARLGSSPCPDACYARCIRGGELPPAAGYIVIGDWVFWEE